MQSIKAVIVGDGAVGKVSNSLSITAARRRVVTRRGALIFCFAPLAILYRLACSYRTLQTLSLYVPLALQRFSGRDLAWSTAERALFQARGLTPLLARLYRESMSPPSSTTTYVSLSLSSQRLGTTTILQRGSDGRRGRAHPTAAS